MPGQESSEDSALMHFEGLKVYALHSGGNAHTLAACAPGAVTQNDISGQTPAGGSTATAEEGKRQHDCILCANYEGISNLLLATAPCYKYTADNGIHVARVFFRLQGSGLSKRRSAGGARLIVTAFHTIPQQ
jgi:hypothetical protein